MERWNDKKNINVTFDVEPSKQIDEFVSGLAKDIKEREDVFKKRIEQLFDEYIEVGGEKKDEAYTKILKVFSIGYQHGWNDCHRTHEVVDQARINHAALRQNRR